MARRGGLVPRNERPAPLAFEIGPFRRMVDSPDTSAAAPDAASLLQNVYPVDGTSLAGRPGCAMLGSAAVAASGVVQHLGQFTKKSGTEYTVAIVSGEIYTVNWGTSAWTKVVSTANLTTAGLTLSGTARCGCVVFADKLIVSDGTNTPFAWDGTSGAGGLTKLTNVPAFHGPPTVYYGRLVGIKATDRLKFVWSEVNDPTLGYEQSGYSNYWELGQAASEALTAIVGTNDGLVVFRARSHQAIQGTVVSNWSSSGTKAGMSETIGTVSPWSVLAYGRSIYFLDADARPQVTAVSGGVQDPAIWHGLRVTCSTLPLASLATAVSLYDSSVELVKIGVTESGATNPTTWFCFDPTTGTPVGVWRGYTFRHAGMVKNASGAPRMLHGDTAGYVYVHGDPINGPWNDTLADGTHAIAHAVTGSPAVSSSFVGAQWDRLDIVAAAPSAMALTVDYETQRGVATTGQSVTLTGTLSLWDVATWDVSGWSTDSATEQKVSVGLNAFGRWLKPRVRHEATSEQFRLSRIRVSGNAVTDTPTSP